LRRPSAGIAAPSVPRIPLASLLYLAEFACDSEEDLPSYLRLNTVGRQTGIDLRVLYRIAAKQSDKLERLRFAA
jgi:hypothetical protein